MNQLKILVEGYVKEQGDSDYQVTSTATLINSGKFKIICDPGLDVASLTKALKKEKLTFSDIDWVFLTHTHLDHSYSVALFDRAKVIDFETIYYQGVEEDHAQTTIPGTDLKIILTPGHADDHCSLIAPVKDKINIVAGDVFWWIADEDQKTDRDSLLEKKDPFATDRKQLLKSRKRLLAFNSYLIPGHGKPFYSQG